LNRDQKIALVIAVVAILTLIVTIFLPETRRLLGFDDDQTLWVFDADGDGHAGMEWPSIKSRVAPSAPPDRCVDCLAAGWKTGIPADDRDDHNPSVFPGADCSTGVGACMRAGKFFYEGDTPVCKSEINVDPQGFSNIAAPNGSWDLDCNGAVEKEWVTCESLSRDQCDPNTNYTHKAAGGFCTSPRAVAGCLPSVAECGQRIWVYPCFWNANDGRCHAGGYETATTMQCK
jgi:hypothetical protein